MSWNYHWQQMPAHRLAVIASVKDRGVSISYLDGKIIGT